MRPMSVIAWLACGGGMSLAGTPELYLFSAAAVAILAIVPGVILLRGEPAGEAV
jgi:hypothetical protein